MIAEQFLTKWWADLDTSLTTDTHVDLETIHRFDCPGHYGGAGKAGAWLNNPAASATGDRWLADVEANGGMAPEDAPAMKPFLVHVGNNRYKLSLPDYSPTGAGYGAVARATSAPPAKKIKTAP